MEVAGRVIVTGSWDGSCRIWDAGTGQQVSVLLQVDGGIETTRFSDDGDWIAVTLRDGTVEFLTISGDDGAKRLADEFSVSSFAFHLRLRDEEGRKVHEFRNYRDAVYQSLRR